jgi:hypothetical protein
MTGPAKQSLTAETDARVDAYLATLDDLKRQDAVALIELMGAISGEPARMWGGSMIGFGNYHYRYESGHEGDTFLVGFAPRKANLVLYIYGALEDYQALLARLGKHKAGKSCLYIKRLSDVDLDALTTLIRDSVERIPTTP